MLQRMRILLGCWLLGLAGLAAAQGSFFREEFAPPSGKGPAVLIMSGQTGPTAPRKAYARKVAEMGYQVLLVDGNDMLNRSGNATRNFNDALALLLGSPNNTTPKAAVIGFSLGGGAALLHAIHRAPQVSMAVTVYPATAWIANIDALVGKFNVPLLLMAAEKDTYKDCCPIERAHQIQKSAQAQGKLVELVTYPDADHGFDLPGGNFRRGDTEDAWKRTTDMLARLHPVTP